MKLFQMIDELLRDRSALYRTAREGKDLRQLCIRLLMLFLISSAIYGAVMGAFRSIHPDYFFSDFELTAKETPAIKGTIAGMMAENKAVYTTMDISTKITDATIRFNTTNPSDAYQVISISKEKNYTKIELAPDAQLKEAGGWMLPFLVALKIPLLFLLTLFVCAFALYIINLAIGMKLHFLPSMTLMLFALAGTSIILLVFAPISMLFTVVTDNYHFMKIMHTIIFIISGSFGVKILAEGLMSMQAMDDGEEKPKANNQTKNVLVAWLILYCLVGAQLAWTLKPFLGTPYLPATPPFRMEKGNIFVSTIESMRDIKPAD
jgi:hypothetical protein